jgi:gluconolactonase
MSDSRLPFLFCLTLLTVQGVHAEEIFIRHSAVEELWNQGEFTEGVAVRSDGLVFFSDIHTDAAKSGQILVFDPATGKTRIHCEKSSKSNGLTFDSGDRLFACCGANGGNRSLSEITESGQVKVLADQYKGRALNAPNDLVVHPNGSIYFSDPRYLGPESLELPGMFLFRFDPQTEALTIASKVAKKPNGVEVSPDGSTLYVAETDNGSAGMPGEKTGLKGRMQLLAIEVLKDGNLGAHRILVDFGTENGIDGMAVDDKGRIFAAVRSEKRFGIAVYDSTGKELDFLKTPSLPTNCGFGAGNDARTLYITAGEGLYRTRVQP